MTSKTTLFSSLSAFVSMSQPTLVSLIATKTWLSPAVIESIIALLEEWNTVPFIARYRKEATMWATDTQLRDFEEIYTYQKNVLEKKSDIIRLLTEKEVLTDELSQAIQKATTLTQLDDIYRPYKDKKNTRATKAIALWLQPLADILLACQLSQKEFEKEAEKYLVGTEKILSSWEGIGTSGSSSSSQNVENIEQAIQWAQDIVAEIIADDPKLRTIIKNTQSRSALLSTKVGKKYEENSTYKNYLDYSKPLVYMPSYAYLAIIRAEKEKQLSVKLSFDEERARRAANAHFVPSNASDLVSFLQDAMMDGVKRLLLPSLERELRTNKKEQSDREAIDIFGKNVKELLLSSPVKERTIMGFDPAYRTWCKIAVVDKTGKFLDKAVVYPTLPKWDVAWAEKVMLELITKHNIDLICLWNWTASRESAVFLADLIKKHDLSTRYLVVSEAWASVYSASSLANEEYPDLDVTIRGAINIAQRVQDPLATYVKIDPKALWIWQYQHDVNQKLLKEKLDNNIQDAVNTVWVDINTASRPLLQHISGLTAKTAKNIVVRREEEGLFLKRTDIKKVSGLWPKAFEQSAGFLRIQSSKEPLDQTGIHPETYALTYTILSQECDITKKNLSLPFAFPQEKKISDLASRYEVWVETLTDIVRELANPWLDPREEFNEKAFASDILTMDDLYEWLELTWVVRNMTDFGVFVDIGLKSDWLVHISQLSDKPVRSVFDVVSLWQAVTVKVLGVDKQRKRVSLTMRG